MDEVRERLFLVGGSYITSGTTSLCASEGLLGVLKKEISVNYSTTHV